MVEWGLISPWCVFLEKKSYISLSRSPISWRVESLRLLVCIYWAQTSCLDAFCYLYNVDPIVFLSIQLFSFSLNSSHATIYILSSILSVSSHTSSYLLARLDMRKLYVSWLYWIWPSSPLRNALCYFLNCFCCLESIKIMFFNNLLNYTLVKKLIWIINSLIKLKIGKMNK